LAFTCLKIFNVPANLLSLGAIDFGIIVDGAVIMVENISRRCAESSGSSDNLLATVRDAAVEVLPSIISATVIIIITFLPVLTFEHVEGRLFKPLAWMMILTLIGAIIATTFFVPVYCYYAFAKRPASGRVSPVSQFVNKTYSRFLSWSVHHTRNIGVLALVGMVLSMTLIPFLGAEFVPELEEGNIWLSVTVLPPSVTLEKSVQLAHQVRSFIQKYPEVNNVLSQIGSPDEGTDPNPYNFIEVLVDLKPKEQWRSQFQNKEQLVSAMDRDINGSIPGLICNFSQYIKDNMEEAMSGVKNGEFAIKVSGKDINVLEDIARQIASIVKPISGMCDVSHDYLVGQPQIVIDINRQDAARFNVNTEDVMDIVETSIGGRAITRVVEGERSFDIMLRFQKDYRDNPSDLGEILVPTGVGKNIPLKQIARIEQKEGANQILRENNRRRVAVYANIRGRNLGAAVLDAQHAIDKSLRLPAGYSMVYAGEFERAREAGARLAVIVPLTILLIYAVLYVMFDSALFALIAISAVPIAISVASVVCFVSGTPLSISSGVGLIALIGLSVQNAVVMLAKIKLALLDGRSVDEAIIYGALLKVRPIVIAALVAAVGLAPAAMSDGIGAQSQRPFAIVISCSIVPVTALCLMIIPALARMLLKRTTTSSTASAKQPAA
jgi:cobalt-zinc-cadmium resistance protein CzcA